MIRPIVGFLLSLLGSIASGYGIYQCYQLVILTDKWWVGIFGTVGFLVMFWILLLVLLSLAYCLICIIEEI